MGEIKISELEPTTDLDGLYTIGSDKNNLSKKVSLQFLREAADYAVEQGDYAKREGETIEGRIADFKAETDVKLTKLESEYESYKNIIEESLENQDRDIDNFKEAVTEHVNNYAPIVINGDVTNAPDEEDITSANNLLQLKNRSALNGMGYVILRKNKTFAEQLSLTNTTYEIRYDFDLSENEVIIPQGCVLLFNGGCLVNGTLVGNHTIIQTDTKKIFEGIKIKGSWDCHVIYSEWFANKTDVLKEVIALSHEDVYNHIVIGNSIYDVSCPSDSSRYSNRGALELNSNTHLTILGEVRMIPNALEFYNVIQLNNSENIRIDGGGYIVGDIDEHSGDTEWGHGISTMAVKNVVIENLKIKNCHGDGINVGITQQLDKESNTLYEMEMSNNIKIRNVVIDKCSRQGISVVHAENCIIQNSFISEIQGRAPMAAIDLEPDKTGYVRNVVIDNIVAKNCELGICIYSQDEERNHLQNISITNCQFIDIRNTDLYLSQSELTEITNCVFSNALNVFVGQYVKKCIISNCIFPAKETGKLSIYENPDGKGNDITIENCNFGRAEISSESAKFVKNEFNERVQFDTSAYLHGNVFNANLNIYSSSPICIIDDNTFNDAALYFRRGAGLMNNNIFNIVNAGSDYLCINASGTLIANNTIIDNRSLSEFYTYLTCNNTIFNGLVLKEHDGCSFPRSIILSLDSNIASYINGVVFQTYMDGRGLVDNSGKIFINSYNFGRAITTPTSRIVGQSCMINGITQWWNGARWVDSYNQTPVEKTSTQRPTLSASDIGISIYDANINRPIWWNGNKWIDASGEDI